VPVLRHEEWASQGNPRWHVSYIPMHGSNRELGKGLVEKIKKDLGLKGE